MVAISDPLSWSLLPPGTPDRGKPHLPPLIVIRLPIGRTSKATWVSSWRLLFALKGHVIKLIGLMAVSPNCSSADRPINRPPDKHLVDELQKALIVEGLPSPFVSLWSTEEDKHL